MGCDIHSYVEVRFPPQNTAKPDERRWVKMDMELMHQDPHHWRDNRVHRSIGWYDERNYSMFGMLANVRNGSGFAGVDLGDGFIPMTLFLAVREMDPTALAPGLSTRDFHKSLTTEQHQELKDAKLSPTRGLPEDVCYEIQEESERWGVDGHSHSYFTLAEYDHLKKAGYFDLVSHHRGVTDHETAAQLKALGRMPDDASWAGDVSPFDETKHVRVEWTETYADSTPYFLNVALPQLWLVSNVMWMESTWDKFTNTRYGITPEDIRHVFWFDN